MPRNQIHDDDSYSQNNKPPWSDLDHDLLHLVMIKLGFGDYYSFRGVCKSWRSLACSNENMVMASMPPMSLSISSDAHDQKACHLKDFQGRKFKTFLPHSAAGECVGLTCGYLIFFTKKTRDFLLVNPITRKELRFPGFPSDYQPDKILGRAILVFSPSISGLVLIVLYSAEIRFSVASTGAWNHVSLRNFQVYDLYAFKGKLYTLTYIIRYPLNERFCLCELRLSPQPKLSILEIKNPDLFHPHMFVSSGESLYVMQSGSGSESLNGLHELDLGEMKWVKSCEEKIEEYAFFNSYFNHVGVAVKRESWADPRSQSLWRYASFFNTDRNGNISFFIANRWYFPHESQNVDPIDE